MTELEFRMAVKLVVVAVIIVVSVGIAHVMESVGAPYIIGLLIAIVIGLVCGNQLKRWEKRRGPP